MEPMVATAEFKDGKVTVWAPTQNPQAVQAIISQELGIPKEDVICHVTLLGGGFGRKSKPDYVAEAAVLSKKTGRPVKVVWSREDDIRFDYFNAVAAMYMKAALDSKGTPTAWLQRSVFPPITSIFDINTVYGPRSCRIFVGIDWSAAYSRFQECRLSELRSGLDNVPVGDRTSPARHRNSR
jgi:isoquinoline 1-oxidoreductase beta subunit